MHQTLKCLNCGYEEVLKENKVPSLTEPCPDCGHVGSLEVVEDE